MPGLVGVPIANPGALHGRHPSSLTDWSIVNPSLARAGVQEDLLAGELAVLALGLQGLVGGLQERDRAPAGLGLGGLLPLAHLRPANGEGAVDQIHIVPAQRNQLAGAQAGPEGEAEQVLYLSDTRVEDNGRGSTAGVLISASKWANGRQMFDGETLDVGYQVSLTG